LPLRDKTLVCRDCGREFTFTVSEQEFYSSRGLLNEPTHCPKCRAARRRELWKYPLKTVRSIGVSILRRSQ